MTNHDILTGVLVGTLDGIAVMGFIALYFKSKLEKKYIYILEIITGKLNEKIKNGEIIISKDKNENKKMFFGEVKNDKS